MGIATINPATGAARVRDERASVYRARAMHFVFAKNEHF
jgi:hypothetical protein